MRSSIHCFRIADIGAVEVKDQVAESGQGQNAHILLSHECLLFRRAYNIGAGGVRLLPGVSYIDSSPGKLPTSTLISRSSDLLLAATIASDCLLAIMWGSLVLQEDVRSLI
jgi:hypothetical protein